MGSHQRSSARQHEEELKYEFSTPGSALEDNAADTELIQATLDAEGVQAKLSRVEAEVDFIGALKDERFDLILADYTLPSFDGLSALRIAQQRAPDIPFIFVSGTLGEDIAIEALQDGRDGLYFGRGYRGSCRRASPARGRRKSGAQEG